jgi:hypothetical protein
MAFPPLPNRPQIQIVKGGVPAEGPKAIPVQCNFATNSGYTIDLTDLFNRDYVTQIPCVFIDNSGNTSSVTVTVQDTGQNIVCPPNSQGYFAVFQGINTRFTAQSAGAVNVPMEFLNFPIAPNVWSINGTPALSNGALQVSDAILEGTVVNGAVQTTINGNLSYTTISSTITAGGTSQQVLAANTSRKAIQIQNLSAGILMVNWGAAASATAGIALQGASVAPGAGGYYESAPGLCSNQSVNIWGATTGQQFIVNWA